MTLIDTHRLNVLKIYLNLAAVSPVRQSAGPEEARETLVLFEITSKGDQLGLLEILPEELGLPLRYSQARSLQTSEDSYRLPDSIAVALASVMPKDEPVWLSLEQPAGYLPV